MTHELAVIGAGNMAEAIVRGVLAKQLLTAEQIIAADVSPQRRELFETELHVRAVAENALAAKDASQVLLSVKPQHMADALAALAPVLTERSLIISIAAGISSSFIEKHLGGGTKWRVVRTMPNTPMLVSEGMAAIAPGAHATREDLVAARNLFSAAADVIEVEEDKMDAVTAVSGSGPAYFFFLVEQMIEAAKQLGLTHEQAAQLATKTAIGSAKLLATANEPAESLRRKVTSPGGTTQAAITHMQEKGWPAITVEAIKAAQRRGRELGQ